MSRYFVLLRDWKISVRTVFGVMGFLYFISLFPGSAVALQTALVRASDGNLYEIRYEKPLSVENFLIHSSDRGVVPRDVIAELYIAARILTVLPFEVFDYEPGLKMIYEDTAKVNRRNRIATLVGSKSVDLLVGALSGGATLSVSTVDQVQDVAITVGGAAYEEAVLFKAYMVARVFAQRASEHQQFFSELSSLVKDGTEIQIDDIKSRWASFLKGAQYEQRVVELMHEYLVVPPRGERLKKYFIDIIPFIGTGRFFKSAGLNIDHLRDLENMLRESEEDIERKVLEVVDTRFNESAKVKTISDLERNGFFNRGPQKVASIREQSLTVGDPPMVLDLSDYFRDPNGDPLTYQVWVDDYDEIEKKIDGSKITITPIAAGSTTVRIIATEPRSGLEVAQIFFVFVNDPPRSVRNQRPESVGTIPDQTLTAGNSSITVNAASYFRDPDGDVLTYAAWSDSTNIVKVGSAGSRITITPIVEGSATVTIRATDPDGLRVFQRVSVTVTVPQNQQPVLPSQEFKRGDAIIVQNTLNIGLNIRGGAGTAWKSKGKAFDGAMGTITDGPVAKNGYTWWKIRWNASNSVVWTNRPASNQGWSIEALLEEGVSLIVPMPDFPDLVVESNRVNKSSLAPGEGFTLSTTVRNAGTGRSAATRLRYYQSSDAYISADDTQVGTNNVKALGANRTVGGSVNLTAPNTPGTYYYGVCVDGVQGENDTSNNCSQAVAITVKSRSLPDLVVASIRVSKTSLAPGEDFTLSTQVQNIGTGDAGHTSLRYYGHGPEVNRKRAAVPRLAANAVSPEKRITLKAPNAEDSYVYEVCIGSVRNESNTNNNCATVTINVGTVPVQDREPEPFQNSSPESVGQISNQELRSDGSALRLDLSNYFRDADGDNLRYTTALDNPNVAFLQVVGTSMDIHPLDVGRTNVTVTASDGSASATQRFAVTVGSGPVRNQAPRTVGTIPTRSMTPGVAGAIQVSGYFSDSDGDSLTYTARSDNTSVVTTFVSEDYLTLTPVRAGNTNVSVTASDGNLTATQRFSVRVGAVPTRNQTPRTIGTIPTRSMTMGAAGAIQVSGYFSDPDGDSLTYTARSDNTRIVTTFVSGDYLTLTPVGVGSATVTVTASDGSSTATQHFTVNVQRTQPTNQPPAAIGTVAPQTLTANGNAWRVNVSSYFRDDNNLTYTARSDNTNVATVRVSGAEVTITPQRAGSTTIHVTASDGSLTAEQNFAVTVTARQQVPVNEPNLGGNTRPRVDRLINPQNFRVGASSKWFNLSSYFSDPDSDKLTYTAASNNRRVVTVRIVDNSIEITPSEHNSGTAEITVTARDPSGLTASFDFRVTIAEAITTNPPGETDPQSDLVIQSVRVSASTLAPGERFKFYATVRNQGSGDAGRTTLRYYRSTDSSISRSDTQVDTDSVTSLDPNESEEEWDTLTAPNSTGIYYFGACVDSVRDESNTNNNCSNAIRITVQTSPPDLVVGSVRVSDATLDPGDSFKFYATVRNQGSGDAGRTTLRYYRSTDSRISTSDTQVDTDSVTSLDPNESEEEWDSLTAPDTPGTYYYGACVDSVTDESNTNNNCSTAVRITVQGTQPPPGLGIGDSIFVQNASGGGLNGLIVRSGAGTGFKWIISAFNGATGTITDGPRQNNGYTWWKVRWNQSDAVFCDVNPCDGWVFEFFRGVRMIAKPGLAAPTLNAVIPQETFLLPNYPNPFNPETWIPYQLSRDAEVTVAIYSVNGALVRTLDLGHRAAGMYQSRSRAAYWDGRNAFGERVASGLYFYTLTAGDFTATRKMLIRK